MNNIFASDFVRFMGEKKRSTRSVRKPHPHKVPSFGDEYLAKLHPTNSTYNCETCKEARLHKRNKRGYGKFIHNYLRTRR